MPDQTLIYHPLSEPDAFRILRLQPSPDRTAQIHCTLEHTCLGRYDYDIIDPYTALSYVWGDASDQRIISVDDRAVAITKNLHDALKCLRDDTRLLCVWADAICINQMDIPERNAQVKQMGRIYSSATHTVIFLDESSWDLEFLIREVGPIVGHGTDFSIKKFEIVWHHFCQVMARPWWRRVWTLQELVLSKDPFVQCGIVRVRWNIFHDFGNKMNEFVRRLTLSPTKEMKRKIIVEPGSYVANVRDTKQLVGKEGGGNTLVNFSLLDHVSKTRDRHNWDLLGHAEQWGGRVRDLVETRRGYGASDPRDIIFAQLGMASSSDEKSETRLEVDYGKSTAQVYAEAAYHMLAEGKNIFRLLERRNATQHAFGLASWVPDWSQLWLPLHDKKGDRNYLRHAVGNYPQWMRRSRQLRPNFKSLQNGKHELTVEVLLLGEIVQLGGLSGLAENPSEPRLLTSYFEPGLTSNEIYEILWDWELSWFDSSTARYVKSRLIDQGFKNLLLAWATAMGLPDETLMPYDEIPDIAELFARDQFDNFSRSSDRPLGLASIAILADLPVSENVSLIPTDRFCTVRCRAAPGTNPLYQILTVPGNTQIGDKIAGFEFDGELSLLIIRRLTQRDKNSKPILGKFEVVGACQSPDSIKISMGGNRIWSDLITLV